MKKKKTILIIVLFIISFSLIAFGLYKMFLTDTGKKVSMDKFIKEVEKSGCNISDKQEDLTGSIKNQAISMDYKCPYYISYVEFNNKKDYNNYVATNIESIENNNGTAQTRLTINLMDYTYYTNTGNNYDLLIAKEDMVILGMAEKKSKDELNSVIANLNIKNKVHTEYSWILVLGIVTLAATIIVIVFTVKKKKENNNA